MSLQLKQQIFEEIEQNDTIVISRHKRPDGDAIGSSNGLAELIKATWPHKKVYVVNEDTSDYLAFLNANHDEIADDVYQNALAIVTDTANMDRISNSKIRLAKKLIKIDHHIDISHYGDISWVESWRSSACEMIADFYNTFKDRFVLNQRAATFIYTGMVTDSGRFRYETVTGETLRLASLFLDQKINTDYIFANLYLVDFDYYKFQAHLYKKMKITEHGVAYLHVDKAMKEKFGLTNEQASEAVSSMNSIKGCIAWIAFIDSDDGTIRVRLRSRFMYINELAEKYGGGGHECTCGATLTSKSQIKKLVADADAMVKNYKETHEGWL